MIFAHLTTNGESTSLPKFSQFGSGKTLRQLIGEGGKSISIDLVGTPDQVANRMGEVMAVVGEDGFLIKNPFHLIDRRYILDITEGLVPALQRRGLVQDHYTTSTLREKMLLEF